MTLRTALPLILAWVGTASSGQQHPVRGYFADGHGALRALTGTPGAWQAPVLVPDGVLSAGYDGEILWYKTPRQLHLWRPGGLWVSLQAPEGPAYARRTGPDGRVQFLFPASGEIGTLDSATELLHIQKIDLGETQWPEWIGPGLKVLRRGGQVLAIDADGAASLVPLAELPPFQLFHRDGTTEVPVSGSFVMPPAAPGDSSTARFRIRNTSSTLIVITRLSIDPSPFKTFDQFFPPRTIEAGGFVDFSVRFSPQAPGEYSSTLHINDLKVTLIGSSIAASSVEIETPGGWQWLKAGEKVNLGTVERRSKLTRRLRITPAAPATISGDGFRLLPGDQISTYIVEFVSDRVGLNQGELQVESRTFPLEVTVTDFPAPKPSIVWTSETGTAKQVKFRVRLSEPARAEVVGLLTLSFIPETGLPDDGAVLLLPNAVRSLTVRFGEGAVESDEMTLQTGTTAGVVRLRVVIGNNAAEETIRIPAAPVVLTQARAAVASANAEVVLTGYDTPRAASRISFTFYLKSGQAAAPGRIDVDVRSAFKDYYKTVSGSAFTLRAHFPVSGTHTELESVEVEVLNSAGSASTGRLRFE